MKKYFCVVLLFASALILSAGDLKDKGEFDVFGGGVHFNNGGGNHGIIGFSGNFGIAPVAQVYGEYSYSPLGSYSSKLNDFQGGIKLGIESDKIEPYGLVGLGVGHFSSDFGGETHFGLHIGAGARIYAPSKRWGVTPEIRWGRYFASGSDLNAFRYTAGVFFQWGK
jgi:hypothetical protein